GALEVTVLDAETGATLPGARVTLGGQTGNIPAEGPLRLVGVPAGPAEPIAALDGYRSGGASGVVPEGETRTLTISLEPVTDGVLSVTVLDDETGQPIPRAAVRIGAFAGETGETGQITSPDIRAGQITVTASAKAYLDGSLAASVVAGEVSETVLRLTPITTGTIFAQVIDAETGAPLPGAVVRLANVEHVVDAEGQVIFADHPAGDVLLGGAAPKYIDGSLAISLKRGGAVSATLALDPVTTGAVIVTVVDDSNGAPLAEAVATLGGISGTVIGPGKFRFEDVPAGRAQVSGAAPLYRDGIASLDVERRGARHLRPPGGHILKAELPGP
ncbi:MAG: carboxypeptidase-like regulatory domain-containing protein, partial [Pseudomonadota bacterium]